MSVPMSNGSVRITWQRPTNSNGRLLDYEVTYGPIGGVERALRASSESITLNGLRELSFGILPFTMQNNFLLCPFLQRLRFHTKQ